MRHGFLHKWRAGAGVMLVVALLPVSAQVAGAQSDPPPASPPPVEAQPSPPPEPDAQTPPPGPDPPAAPPGGEAQPPTPREQHFPVPESGSGRRIVYSNSQQRVWLVEDDGSLAQTYLVSGRHRFPRPGTYRVFSKSRHSRLGSDRFEYMVRFAPSRRLSVGFHSIPVGRRGPVQSEADLGSPRSRGCVRQRLADAAFLWEWAPVGTRVILTP